MKTTYRRRKYIKSTLKSVETVVGETIEQKIERMMHNKEGIEAGADLIYQEKGEGVNPRYDPRYDKFEGAVEAMDKIQGEFRARSEARMTIVKDEKEVKDQTAEGTKITDKTDQK